MNDIRRHTGTEIFQKRTLEIWLAKQDRYLQDQNWLIVEKFLQSAHFKKYVPYANEGSAENRLIKVAEGLTALYGEKKRPDGILLFPSKIHAQGLEAIKILKGDWENIPNQKDRDVPRVICKIEPVLDKRYAKIAYIALFRSKQISTSGIVIYLNTHEMPDYDYCHSFVLQLWRRKDPESGSVMPGELTYLTLAKNQPEFSISNTINHYFYKSDDDSISEAVVLKISKNPITEETLMVDFMLEDVLPHGFTET